MNTSRLILRSLRKSLTAELARLPRSDYPDLVAHSIGRPTKHHRLIVTTTWKHPRPRPWNKRVSMQIRGTSLVCNTGHLDELELANPDADVVQVALGWVIERMHKFQSRLPKEVAKELAWQAELAQSRALLDRRAELLELISGAIGLITGYQREVAEIDRQLDQIS